MELLHPLGRIKYGRSLPAGKEHWMKTAQAPGDDDLLKLMIAGDEEGFTALYRRRQGGIYRFALHMSGSAEVAEDVTQDAFQAAMLDAGLIHSPRRPPSVYLLSLA